MPHQCVRCSTFYEDGSIEILKGCKCGGKLFFFIKKEKLEEAKRLAKEVSLSMQEKEQMEKDVYDIVGSEKPEEPVVLEFESVRILKPGQYEIDLISRFNDEPLIFKLEEGKYMIDIAQMFDSIDRKRKAKKR